MSAIVESFTSRVTEPALPKADPCVVVIFGALGDLTQRKLVPALYRLSCAGCTADQFRVLGVGRRHMDDNAFRDWLRMGVASSDELSNIKESDWQSFAQRIFFLEGDANSSSTYTDLSTRLRELNSRDNAGDNHLFYLSIPPSLAFPIVEGLGKAGLATQEQGWSRIVVEKPFGSDLTSAQALNTGISEVFQENQIYRIDHYLGKETVQNILVFRFGNSIFEPVWNRNYVDYVEITAGETSGVGSRAGYYEEAGALRDMVANHLLQLLTLTAMEPPVAFDADSVREEKVQVLRSIQPMTPNEVAERTVRGQYDAGEIGGVPVAPYKQEKGVKIDSPTETYTALEFHIENWRWAGVPFYVRTGKRLARSITEIAVHFKPTPQALFAGPRGKNIEPNVIALRIQPNEGISVSFEAKQPGAEMRTGTVRMDFCYHTAFGVRPPAAYETLLLDALRGDPTLFTRRDEVEAQWRLITPIHEAWTQSSLPALSAYPAGSNGPAEADRLLARNGHRWRGLHESLTGCDA